MLSCVCSKTSVQQCGSTRMHSATAVPSGWQRQALGSHNSVDFIMHSVCVCVCMCVCVCARTRVCNGGVPCDAGTLSIHQEAGLEPELMNLALMSSPREMLDAARWVGLKRAQEQCVAHACVWLVDCRYFEGSLDTVDRAIILYHKVGEH